MKIEITYLIKPLFLIAFLLLGCQTAKHQNQGKEVGNHGKRKAHHRTERNSTTSKENSVQPSNAFLNFTNYLDSIGYISDTARAQIAELSLIRSKIKIIYFENKPFYLLSAKNHDIQRSKQFLKNFKKMDTLTVDFDVFLQPISIFAYYYRQKSKSNLIEDGIIEEWHFSSKSEAQQAFTEINKMLDYVYINTYSFTLVRDNKLYIFHTRASAFGITLGNFYERFKVWNF